MLLFQMETLSKLLSSRRIPGEHANKRVDPVLLVNEIKPEETVEEVIIRLMKKKKHIQQAHDVKMTSY